MRRPILKMRVPLLAKILTWLFLNLVVLGAAFFFVFRLQFQFGLDALLAGRAGERIQAVSEVIADQLKDKPGSGWSEVLKNFGRAYKVEFYLFRLDGTQLAGEPISLPPPVAAKLSERRGPGEGMMGRGPPPGRGPRWAGEGVTPGPHARFILRSQHPTRYWVGVRLPLNEADAARPWPATLLLASDSLRAGGLFFDITPWVLVGFGALVFSVVFWVPLVRGVTRSLSQMTRATEQIAQGHFEVRVADRRSDELGRLGQAINSMAGRLSGLVHGQKRFLGDIAHELCSPLARMQMALGLLEQRASPAQEPYVRDVREEVEQMSDLVNELLSFSRASLASKEIKLERVNVVSLAQRVLAREAPAKGQVQVQVEDSLSVLAEPELLARALANLVRNAIRYAGEAGPIRLTGAQRDQRVTLTLVDEGPGVPEGSLQQIFDPFYRAEPSRSRTTGGVGLGLAIVRTCVEACQGTVTAKNRVPRGLQVDITLPACAANYRANTPKG